MTNPSSNQAAFSETLRNKLMRNPFMEQCGIVTEEIHEDYVRLRCDHVPEICNPYGRVHGGLLYTMQDCCGGMTARTDGRDYVTLDATIHYVANITEGRMIAESQLVSRTRKICVVHVDIKSESGQLLTYGEVTMYCLSKDAPQN